MGSGSAESQQVRMLTYLEEVPVRCISPTSFLSEVGVKVEDIDFLMVDAEGYEFSIASSFTSLAGFRPAVIAIECFDKFHLLEEDFIGGRMLPLASSLAASGYDVYQHTE